MLRRTAPQATSVHTIALSMDGEEMFTPVNTTQSNRRPLYALAIALRIGFVAALLLKAFAIWQW